MKRNTQIFLVLMLFVFLFVASASARLLAPKQGGKGIRVNGVAETAEIINTEEGFSTLMGSEECNEKDEECLNRRMMADAHLDYIYTQHHKKP